MGTNVYMCRIPTESDLTNIKKAVDRKDFTAAKLLMDIAEEEIHIGKRSGGWKFLFAPNPQHYEENRKSINKFLHKKGWVLRNEYGETIPPEYFWKEYVEDFEGGYDHDTYIQDHPYEDRFTKREHYSEDGLRFSCTNDFA